MWQKLTRIPRVERRLLLRAFVRVASVRLALSLLPWARVGPRCRTLAARKPLARGPTVPQVVWAVDAASRRIPGGSNCLVKALAAQRLLAENGHAATIHFGVRRDSGSRLGAHAWVTCAGEAVIGRTAEPFQLLESLRL